MSKHAYTLALALLALECLGCDEAKQAEVDSTASLQANTTIAAKDFELATVVELVEREDVRDAESLEALINAEDSTIHVDVDGDGTRDFIQVHEVGEAGLAGSAKVEVKAEAEADGALRVAGKDGEAVHFELRVVPSSKVVVQVEEVEPAEVETVVVATVEVKLDEAEHRVIVEARYAPTVVVVSDVEVEHVYVHHIELEHRHDHWVVVGSPFVAWVWIDARPFYYGHVHLPPGQAKKMGLYWHGGHHGGGHGNGHWKGGGHGGGHGGHHAGPGKVHVKAKGGPSGGGGKSKGGKGGKGKH
jgi:hypothetical protein